MEYRKKILILEHDDFLREILGNLLHKKGNYIINGFSIAQGIKNSENEKIHSVILGTSCEDYDEKHSINFIKKELGSHINLFLINDTDSTINLIPKNKQMHVNELSIEKLINELS